MYCVNCEKKKKNHNVYEGVSQYGVRVRFESSFKKYYFFFVTDNLIIVKYIYLLQACHLAFLKLLYHFFFNGVPYFQSFSLYEQKARKKLLI